MTDYAKLPPPNPESTKKRVRNRRATLKKVAQMLTGFYNRYNEPSWSAVETAVMKIEEVPPGHGILIANGTAKLAKLNTPTEVG